MAQQVLPCIEAWAFERLRWLGGEALVESVVDEFLEEVPRRLLAARAALARGDMSGVSRACAALQSCAMQLGAVRLAAACAGIDHVRRTTMSADAPALLQRIAREAEAVVAALRGGLVEPNRGDVA